MATLKQIRTAVKTLLEENVTGIKVHRTIPKATTGPAVVVRPSAANFHVTMGPGIYTWELALVVIVPMADSEIAQDNLDELIDGYGSRSIRGVIFANKALGLNSGTSATLGGMTGYGTLESAGYENISAVLTLTVNTKA